MKSILKFAVLAAAAMTALSFEACGPSQKEIEAEKEAARQDSLARIDSLKRVESQLREQKIADLNKVVTPDMVLFDVHGPVKSIRWGGKYVAKFSKSGTLVSFTFKGHSLNIRRNGEGVITSCTALIDDPEYADVVNVGPAKVSIDTQSLRVKKLKFVTTSDGSGYYDIPNYDENGNIVSLTTQEYDNCSGQVYAGKTHTASFSGYDEIGNWTSTNLELGVYYNMVFVKKRAITYYSPEEILDGASSEPEASAPRNEVHRAARASSASSGDDFAWLSQRLVTSDDLAGKSSAELRILRNAIYARHGYIFKSADLANYFSQFGWYNPVSHDVQSSLSSIESRNVQIIKSFE